MLTCAYLGNFDPPHSTENEVRKALEALGHRVLPLQEGAVRAVDVPRKASDADLLIWTQTYSLAEQGGTLAERRQMVDTLRAQGTPTVGVHLDRWWGLSRQDQIDREPFFRVDLLCTADGGHDAQWRQAGVNHVWMAPAVSEFECVPAEPSDEYAADVAFVGNWGGSYHREWRHRRELVRWLRRTYRNRVRLWPERGQPAVRGDELRALYASVKVVVGDSCLAPTADGKPMSRYCSDRLPETLGRGGLLVHPHVDGVTDGTLYEAGEHLACWTLGNWRQLQQAVDRLLEDAEERTRIVKAGREHVLTHHTYTQRMVEVLDECASRGLV